MNEADASPPGVATREEFASRAAAVTLPRGASSFAMQASSGSSGGKILQVPRTEQDVADILRRVCVPFVARFGRLPRRIALVGGASHESAADTLRHPAMEIVSFRTDCVGDIQAFAPDVLATYPSVFREFMALDRAAFDELRAVKLGGEAILDADLAGAFAWDPALAIVEQFGSTEMPAVAVGLHTGGVRSPLVLQHDRYAYHFSPVADEATWQPLVVEDRFADLLVRLDRPYDTGDEVRVGRSGLLAVRRAAPALAPWVSAQNELLASGCTNVQFDLGNAVLRYSAMRDALPSHVCVNGVDLATLRAPMLRLPSNKLRLVL